MSAAIIIAIAVAAVVVLVAVGVLLLRGRADDRPVELPAEPAAPPKPAPSAEPVGRAAVDRSVPPPAPTAPEATEPDTVEEPVEDLEPDTAEDDAFAAAEHPTEEIDLATVGAIEHPTEEMSIEEVEAAVLEQEAEAAGSVPPPTPSRPPRDAEARKSDIKALKKGLASTRGGFISRLAKLFSRKKEIDPELLDELQEVLITADVGVATSERILSVLKERMEDGDLQDGDAVWDALRAEARAILSAPAKPLVLGPRPAVILVVGVNGVGKTTTIGKLASRFQKEGSKVILAAGDTFRAAAVPQLEVWGQRTGCEVVKGKHQADPGSVLFDAVERAQEVGADLVIADTAGRLHTKSNLMEELKKVHRIGEKALGRAIDEVLLVLDSTTGQNAIQQAQLFKDAIPVSGLALTKLDGTAKGGVILRVVDEHELPVRFVGIGERVEDLREFDAETFVEALFEKPDGEAQAA